jgi:hypothetical protein
MHTPSLRELQGLFWGCISQTPGTTRAAAALVAVTRPGPTLDREACLSIYADAYFLRLRDVLAENFPRVAALLGAERFDALALDHLRDHPSEHPSVRHVGRDLAATIAGRPDCAPWLADLARLEWARLEVFDAPDSEVLGADSLRPVRVERWPTLHFHTIPALTVVRADWPVHRLWQEDAPPDLAASPTAIRVWRAADGCVFHARMDPQELHALEHMMAAEPFAAVCAAFDGSPPAEAGREAVALLARWLEDGIVAGVRR